MDPAQSRPAEMDDVFLGMAEPVVGLKSHTNETDYARRARDIAHTIVTDDRPCDDQHNSPPDAETEEEKALIQDLIQGDQAAFWKLWDRHKRHLYAVCLTQMKGVQADAEDALSRVMLKAWDRLPRYAVTIINLKAWLMRLTYNLCVEIHRESKRRTRILDSISEMKVVYRDPTAHSFACPEEILLRNEMYRFVTQVVDEMPASLREPLILRFEQDMTCREIAKRLVLTTDNVRKRIQRARAILQSQLGRYLSGLCGSIFKERASTADKAARGLSPEYATEQKDDETQFKVRKICVVEVVLPSGAGVNFPILLRKKPSRCNLKIETLSKYVRRHPRGWKKRLELAHLLYVSGRWQEAIEQYRFTLEKHPQSLSGWLELGTILRHLQRDEEAIEAYERALPLARSATAYHHITGLIEVCRGRYDSAAGEFKHAASLEANSAPHWHTLGLLHLRAEHPLQALGAFYQALAADPQDIVALTYSYDVLVTLGQTQEAARRVESALALDPENLPALKRLADHRSNTSLVYGAEGKKTERLIRRALLLAPDTADAHESLALFHISRGEWKEGIAVLSSFTERRPNNPLGWYNFARWLFRTGEPESAAESVMNAYFLCRNDENINRAVCRILPHAGRLKDLRPLLEEMPERFPDQWGIWATVGRVMAEWFKESELACKLSSHGTELQPYLSQAWFQHGRVLALADKHWEAIRAIKEGWKWLPEEGGYKQSVPAAAWLGESYGMLGDESKCKDWWKEAANRAQRLMAVDPATGYYWRGKAFESLGDGAGALKAYRTALSRHLLHPLRQEVNLALELLQPQRPCYGMD
jgi:RNA polymerase sigma factor (sigma-70 family)